MLCHGMPAGALVLVLWRWCSGAGAGALVLPAGAAQQFGRGLITLDPGIVEPQVTEATPPASRCLSLPPPFRSRLLVIFSFCSVRS